MIFYVKCLEINPAELNEQGRCIKYASIHANSGISEYCVMSKSNEENTLETGDQTSDNKKA